MQLQSRKNALHHHVFLAWSDPTESVLRQAVTEVSSVTADQTQSLLRRGGKRWQRDSLEGVLLHSNITQNRIVAEI